MRLRGFEVVSAYQQAAIVVPVRKTKGSAGYDLAVAEDTRLTAAAISLVTTGLKAYMSEDEYLSVHIRSGLSVKYCLSLINGQGIIDSDYYNNTENEGHILLAIYNHSQINVDIPKGTRIAQAIFQKYLTVDEEKQSFAVRAGGFGSTGAQ